MLNKNRLELQENTKEIKEIILLQKIKREIVKDDRNKSRKVTVI